MSRHLRRGLVILVPIVALLVLPSSALAHPLGNFTINTSSGIVVSPGTLRVDYVVDMAEIPTVQARPRIDADGDGVASQAELATYASGEARDLRAGLDLRIGEEPVVLDVVSAHALFLPGQGGLDVLRLEVTFAAEAPDRGDLTYADSNFDGRVGWHEVTATGIDGVSLEGSDVPTTSPSDRLRAYPEDLLSSPLDVRSASASFAPGTGSMAAAEASGEGATAERATAERQAIAEGGFVDLLGRNGPLMLVALVLAFGFGALHALGPGHGKTLMAAYLVGAGGRARHAVAVGAAVATMHTASVLALGFAVFGATSVFAPERVYPWLGFASGLVAIALGAGALSSRLGDWSEGRHREDHHHHDHVASGHDRAPVLSRKGMLALAVAGGILPSPTALVVLLASVALHRIGYGLALIGAFSLGLAVALVGVGLLALRARDVVARRMSHTVSRLVPVLSASAIVVVGLVLAANGLTQLQR